MNVLIWTQHLLGTGHLRRSLAIARAIAARNIPVTVATGGAPARFSLPDRVQVVQLDPVHAAAGDFSALQDALGAPWTKAARQARADALLDLAAFLRPAVLVTELFPFGRRAFAHEVLPVIEQVRAKGGKIVCSVRDVLVDKHDPAKLAAMRDIALAYYDRILVHGDPGFLPFSATFPDAAMLADRIIHTGFVVDRTTVPAAARSGVLVSAGGGRVGGHLLAAAAAARSLCSLAADHWHLVGGAALGDFDRRSLTRDLGPPGTVDAHLNDLPQRLAGCRLSISQAGYNTVAEALMGAAPMVLVPFAEAGESEQPRRAARLAELGRAVVVGMESLLPTDLAIAIDRACGQDPCIGTSWSFDGAAFSASLIDDLLR